MKATITLTEAELKKAVLDYLENNTTISEEINHSAITITFSSGAYGEPPVATIMFDYAIEPADTAKGDV
jgi:hypothetical protein